MFNQSTIDSFNDEISERQTQLKEFFRSIRSYNNTVSSIQGEISAIVQAADVLGVPVSVEKSLLRPVGQKNRKSNRKRRKSEDIASAVLDIVSNTLCTTTELEANLVERGFSAHSSGTIMRLRDRGVIVKNDGQHWTLSTNNAFEPVLHANRAPVREFAHA